MSDNRIYLLIEKVIEKTLQGKIEWENGAILHSFVYNMEETSITIFLGKEGHDNYVYFSVLDGTGMAIESLKEKVTALTDKKSRPINYLYYIARRNALKIDETVFNIMAHLDVL